MGASPRIMLGILKVSLSVNLSEIQKVLTNALAKVDEDDIGEDREAVPPAINDNVTPIPQLT
jgi:hypothetical protein